jgi:arylsulfate sulfotransferase
MKVLRITVWYLLPFCCVARMTVTLAPSTSLQQQFGTPVTWTATVSFPQSGSIEYSFSGRSLGAPPRILRVFHRENQFTWAPFDNEGPHLMEVVAKNRSTGETASSQVRFHVNSNVTGAAAVISSTQNPLVALYSAPGCPAGSSMYVRFGTGSNFSQTDSMPCTPNASMNFYIAGMLPSTTYRLHSVVISTLSPGSIAQTVSIAQQFTTGAIDPSLAFPNLLNVRVVDERSSLGQGILLLDFLSPPNGPYYFPTAINMQGLVVWYYPLLGVASQNTTYFIRPVPKSGGHMLLIANDPKSNPDRGQILREIDLAGNTVSETFVSAISQQLAAQGKAGITEFNHEAIRLPNGHTLVLCSQERMFPAGTQGAPTAVDVVGNAIVDLDQNWNVTWSWSAYDHLDVNRAAVLGETCDTSNAGCPELILSTTANDWLHANSLNYLPQTGNILLSIRHQDWVVKINYADGAGSGGILWRLGAGGDFNIQSDDPYPWFSHQHDAQLNSTTGSLWCFDNGNTRVARNGGVGNSRGYALQLDETKLTATPVLVADLGVYSVAVGSAQVLDNGNYHFHAGFITTPTAHAFTYELLPDGTQDSIFEEFAQVYRSYRMSSLYSLN